MFKKFDWFVYLILIIILLIAPYFIEIFFGFWMGGCFEEIVSYGWPAQAYKITKSCFGHCCDQAAVYPVNEVNYAGIIIDLIYYTFLGFLVYKLVKSIRRKVGL